MFFELGQIEKIETGISSLADSKQILDKKHLQAYSSDQNKIQNSLLRILQTVLAQSQKTLSTIKQIEDQIQMGYFIPSDLNIEQLVYDASQLPEWFQFVFKKQYEKQKKNLDALSKKAYKMQSLPDTKHNIEKQIQSFRLLIERYQILSSKQKGSLNILGQAEIIKSKCKNCKQKYNIFCKSISSKILSFLEESVSKSLNFSNSMNHIGNSVSNSFNLKLQPDHFEKGYLTNKFKQTAPTFNTDNHFRQKTNKSVDFYGRTMYSKVGNDYSQMNTQFNRLNSQINPDATYNRYVPRHVNTTAYDFYN